MKIRKVISKPLRRGSKHFGEARHARRFTLKFRQSCERAIPLSSRFREQAQTFPLEHHQSPVTSHFPTATPYPIAPLSLAIPAAPAAFESLHPGTPSTFRSLPPALFRLRGDSTSPRQTAIETRQHFAARAVIPAAPPLWPHLSRVPAASFA